MAQFRDDMTLKEARELLRTMVVDGARCPCCTQMAKVYRRKVNSTNARSLITLYRAGGASAFLHAPSLPGDTHEISQMAWWGLIEEENVIRPDGGRAGFWRMTERGVQWVMMQATILKYALVYDSRCLGFQGKNVTIQDALSSRFNYSELMAGI
jgi:hypothetical protein